MSQTLDTRRSRLECGIMSCFSRALLLHEQRFWSWTCFVGSFGLVLDPMSHRMYGFLCENSNP